MKIKITDNAGTKRLKAEFIEDGKVKKTTNFGMKGSKGTFADGATEETLELSTHVSPVVSTIGAAAEVAVTTDL